jgi:Ni/Fe-hydrogenase subunit HybB-like protein
MSTSSGRPSVWTVLALGLFGVAVVLIGVRFVYGLGAIANINDAYPWGWWIGFGVMAFISLGACGFTMALLVDVFGLHRFHGFVRPGMVLGLLFYLSYMVILGVEVGRPWKAWIVFLSWGHTSALWEIAWCATIYTTCLILEFGGVATERFEAPRLRRILTVIYLPVVIVGVTFSHFHQSSLGTMMTIVPLKVDDRWWSEMLPLTFLLTAYSTGVAVAMVEHVLATRYLRLKPRVDLLAGLGKVQLIVVGLFLLIRFGDLIYMGTVESMLTLEWLSLAIWIELLIGFVLPFALLAVPQVRNTLQGAFASACLLIFGNLVMRNNIAVLGMKVESWHSYVPAAGEVLTTVGVLAGAIVLYGFLLRHLPIHEEEPLDEDEHSAAGARAHGLGLSAKGAA